MMDDLRNMVYGLLCYVVCGMWYMVYGVLYYVWCMLFGVVCCLGVWSVVCNVLCVVYIVYGV